MKYTLSQAAAATGKNKATIQRAIKSGKISASKNSSGAYQIDPSELHRVFSATTKIIAQHDISNETHHTEALHLKLKLLEIERERERDQMQSTIEDLRKRLDRSEDRISALLPTPEKRSWLPWKRG